MTAYLQMGHDSENLVAEKDLDEFKGIVLSPVNRDSESLAQDIKIFRKKQNFDIVFDPQLYIPTTDRGSLLLQPYFPADIDTADMTSDAWWGEIVTKLASCVSKLGVDAVASPVVLPKAWSDDYFARCTDTSRRLTEALAGSQIRPLTSVMVSFNEIGQKDAALRIASLVSEADSAGYYVVIVSETEPRRELSGETQLAGVMTLIAELERTQRPVLVSHCSSDMLLFKAAGASHCATGKFFNLRRFTRTRYEENGGGGGVLAYWFEHSLLAFLREADVGRLIDSGFDLINTGASNNYWSQQIVERFPKPTKPWVALGWRQYLSWFGKVEVMLTAADRELVVENWLEIAEENWLKLKDEKIFMDEPRNDGRWIRSWRQGLAKFQKDAKLSSEI